MFITLGPGHRSSSFFPRDYVWPESVKVPNIRESQRWIKQATSDLTTAQMAIETFSSQVIFEIFFKKLYIGVPLHSKTFWDFRQKH